MFVCRSANMWRNTAGQNVPATFQPSNTSSRYIALFTSDSAFYNDYLSIDEVCSLPLRDRAEQHSGDHQSQKTLMGSLSLSVPEQHAFRVYIYSPVYSVLFSVSRPQSTSCSTNAFFAVRMTLTSYREQVGVLSVQLYALLPHKRLVVTEAE